MEKNYLRLFACLAFIMLLVACKTEQKQVKSSSPMVSYNEDFAKNQARLMNETTLDKTVMPNTPVALNNGSQKN